LIIFGAAIAAALSLSSCGGKEPEVNRIPWMPDGAGYLQFWTNNPDDYDEQFPYFPPTAGNSLPGAADWSVEVDALEESGAHVGGHGLLCGYTSSSHDWFCLILRCDGHYKFIYKENGHIKGDESWSSSAAIHSAGNVNTIAARYDNATKKITFSINGSAVSGSFDYNNGSASQAGFFNGILGAEYELFPDYYSDRRFKLRITLPTPYTYPEP
jgi:hypothetical protein